MPGAQVWSPIRELDPHAATESSHVSTTSCHLPSASAGIPCGSAGKESASNVGDLGAIPGLGRCPREGKGYPLQYSGLENSMASIVHGVTKSQTPLSDFHFTSLLREMTSMPPQLLTFHTPWREFRNGALCVLGKLAEQVFRELNIFRNWFS